MGFSFVNILFPIFTCMCTFAMETTFYGGSGGGFLQIYDQGRITGITSWGYETTLNAIIIDSWTSESKTNSDKIGIDPIEVACTPFSLNSNEYIDGVQVIYNGLVRRISFHISNGNTQTCSIDQTVYDTFTDLWDPELIIIPGTYLTGFKFRYGTVIDAVGFEFTSWSPSSITITDMYGGNGGGPKSLFDFGRINAITNWGFSNDNPLNLFAVGIIDWTSDQQSSSTTLGWQSYMDVECTPFTLSSDQYIDGYRIMYNSVVNYIAFQISDGSTKVCAVSPLPSGLTDTGWNTVYHSQLTGFWAKTGAIIDQIVLQFTNVPLTCPSSSYQVGGIMNNNDIWGCGLLTCEERYDTNNIEQCKNKCASNVDCVAFNYAPKGGDYNHQNNKVCTLYDSKQIDGDWGYQIFCILITSNPTQSPTKNPTISPTQNPSISPTKYPTKNPSISPTKYPTKYPTISPTTNPTKNPTSMPTTFPTKRPSDSPSTYSPTPHSGEIIDETTANPLTSNANKHGGNGVEAESSILQNEMFIFVFFLVSIILLCSCIVCLCLVYFFKKKKGNGAVDLEKLKSVSMTTTVNVGERKSVELNAEMNNGDFYANFSLPAPPPKVTTGQDGMKDFTGFDDDSNSDETDSDDNLLYIPGKNVDMNSVTAGGNMQNNVSSGGEQNI